MEKKFTLWSKRMLAIAIVLFIAGGWGLLFYQEKQGTPITSDRSNYVRLHILANSDSVQDQKVKLKVRDAVIAYLTPHVKDVADAQEAKKIIFSHQEEIVLVAQNCLADNGFDYPVDIQIGSFAFPVRSYGDLVLPAGEYQAVRILLGNAAGQNWWCVLFPPLCFIEGTNVLASPSKATQQPENNPPLEFRWKLAEIFLK
ncbi:MAG: stage sporulation protein [Firmicutes bacterium]|nr:stage sporulation protein [Bacillota bacterium]